MDTSEAKVSHITDLEFLVSNKGKSVKEISNDQTVLLVFLRHFGCHFCRGVLKDVAKSRKKLTKLGVELALVHMEDEQSIGEFLKEYGLADLHLFHDGKQVWYKKFGLERGSFSQLFSMRTMLQGMRLMMKERPMISKSDADHGQMPGFFLMKDGNILGQYFYKTISDKVDYIQFVKKHI